MRRLCLAAGILMGLVSFAKAAERSPQTYAFDSLTVDTSTRTLTSAKIIRSSAKEVPQAWMTMETGDMAYTLDGSSPTVANCHIMKADAVMTVVGYEDLQNFRFMQIGSTAGKLKVSYQK